MNRLSCFTAIAVVAASLAFVGSAPAASSDVSAKRGCDASSIEMGGREYVFYKHHMSCERAKRYAHHVYNSNGNWEPRYFNCVSSSNFNSGASCTKRRGQNERFGWHPYD
jgi:hypothetical protein